MHVLGIVETVLYVSDVEKARSFYQSMPGFEPLNYSPEQFVFFRVGANMLLLFNPKHANNPENDVPTHGQTGSGHVAFAVNQKQMENAGRWLNDHNIPIERDYRWPNGKRSIYFRDPFDNSLEFTTYSLWGIDEKTT